MFITALSQQNQHNDRPAPETRVGKRKSCEACSQALRAELDSQPIQFNSAGIKPWGRRPVLEAGSGRFESFIPDLFLLHRSKAVMQRAVNSLSAGSNPADAAILRPGVTATQPAHNGSILSSNLRGATTGNDTETPHKNSIKTPFTGHTVMNTHLQHHLQHQQTCANAGKILMGISVTSNVTGFDPVVPGAAPGSPELCLSYSGFITPGCDSGNVDSNSIRHPKLSNPIHLEETLERARHRIWRHLLMVRKPNFQSGDAGSIPVDATDFYVPH